MERVIELEQEIERLSNELDQTTSEKNQAAQYGLVLLEEKESLQTRCDELEAIYENTKHDLDITQEVLYASFYVLSNNFYFLLLNNLIGGSQMFL